MDFTYTSEQEALRDSVRRFVEREYGWERRFELIRAAPGADRNHWATFAELGLLGAGLSEDEGGFGGGAVENALIAEELGRALVIEPFIAHVVATQIVSAIGGEIGAMLIEPMVMGERRIVPALGEAAGRGDPAAIAAVASRDGDDYRVSGAKTLVDGASQATDFIMSALHEGGLALFLVAAAADGLSRRDYRTLDNHRVADLTLDGAPAQLIASGDVAAAAMARGLDHGLIALGGEALGTIDAAMWATRDYLKIRRQFGATLSTFQALQHRMADVLIEVELTRSLLFHALGAAAGSDAAMRAAAASALKVQIAKGGLLVTREAIQFHGGIGVTEELNISHVYRRLFVIARLFGDADVHLDRFSAIIDARLAEK
ncbi:acyl-CoA dehydrogenase family protein [Rhizorhabdus argentea]|uniref:acyl-CoA dehydrogenase family protein n=1 Tax=Rhizorhabdus argentea TaxID=1387174 RepID=UPI0030EC36B3